MDELPTLLIGGGENEAMDIPRLLLLGRAKPPSHVTPFSARAERPSCPDINWLAQLYRNSLIRGHPMDMSDVAVRHTVALSNLNIQHSFDISPSAVAIAREVRFCVIAIVVGWITTRVISAISKGKVRDP